VGRKYIDLIAVSALAVIAVGVSPMGVDAIWRLPFALLLVFVLPGYALTGAVLGRTRMNLERGLLTLGLSLVTAALSGFVLNWLPWGLRAETWASLLAIITISASFAAFVRWPAASATPVLVLPRLRIVNGLLLGLAAVVIVGAIVMTSSVAAQYPSTEVVQLWMLPGGKLDPGSVKVGVINKTPAPATFRIQIQQGNSILDELPAIAVPAGGTWETAVAVSRVQPEAGPVETFLYRADAPDVPYRHVLLWLNSQGQ
jgi:uncharacterized membrane protein